MLEIKFDYSLLPVNKFLNIPYCLHLYAFLSFNAYKDMPYKVM